MDKLKISLVIQSMLNDAMVEVNHAMEIHIAQERLRFVKYLVHMFPNTDKKIDFDVVYKQFKLEDK
jgi:alpha-glucuronidase